jgi:hypothetical protein
VNGFTTQLFSIETGVPQGAVLSPLLFSIYINDIPILNVKNKEYSLLFADDLASFFIYKKDGKINHKLKKYMGELELWLKNWRLNMQPKKCNFMLFNKNSNSKLAGKINIELLNEKIPSIDQMKFLGINFDTGLTFNKHVKELKKKCNNRLNIIKIISNKSWYLTRNQGYKN